MSAAAFNPKTDIPDQSGRVFLVTGGTQLTLLSIAEHH
jgi:hypothetical protein